MLVLETLLEETFAAATYPVTERFVPDADPKVSCPFMMVDELKVAVAFVVWAPVQVTDEAAVTNPGFMKERVTEPDAFEAEMYVPEVMEVTPMFVYVMPEEAEETERPVPAKKEKVDEERPFTVMTAAGLDVTYLFPPWSKMFWAER